MVKRPKRRSNSSKVSSDYVLDYALKYYLDLQLDFIVAYVREILKETPSRIGTAYLIGELFRELEKDMKDCVSDKAVIRKGRNAKGYAKVGRPKKSLRYSPLK